MPIARERTLAPASLASWRAKGRGADERAPESSLALLPPPPPRMRAKRRSAKVCFFGSF